MQHSNLAELRVALIPELCCAAISRVVLLRRLETVSASTGVTCSVLIHSVARFTHGLLWCEWAALVCDGELPERVSRELCA